MGISITVWVTGFAMFGLVIYLIWRGIPTMQHDGDCDETCAVTDLAKRWTDGPQPNPNYKYTGKRRKNGVVVWLRSWIPRMPSLFTPAPHGDGDKSEIA